MNLIVGIDPGTTVGVACLDFSGNTVFVHSEKSLSQGDVIRIIGEHGHPVVIASDVKPMPETVAAIARSFGAVTFEEQLSVADKDRMAPGRNDHERDALSAALNAFAQLEAKIIKARKAAREAEEGIIAAVLKGERIHDQVKERTEVEEEKREELRREQGEVEAKLQERVVELNERLRALKQTHEKAALELANTSQKNSRLNDLLQKRKYAEVDADKRVRELQHNLAAKQRDYDASAKELKDLTELLVRVAKGELQVVEDAAGYNLVTRIGALFFVKGRKAVERETLDASEVEELVGEYKSRNP